MTDRMFGSCWSVADHVRNYDFVIVGRMTVKPSARKIFWSSTSRECLAIKVKRKLNSGDVVGAWRDLSPCASCRPKSDPTMVRVRESGHPGLDQGVHA